MKIAVDRDKCTGHAQCNAAAPDVYELDDNGYCAITELEILPKQESDARAGAAQCPERAITIST